MATQLRFGIAGLGVASTQILPYLVNNPQARIVAASDVRRAALDQFERDFGGETFLSVEELCRSPNVDALYVCTPNHLHAEHVICAAEHGKHVIVEKPMALTLDECEAMNTAAERNGTYLLCGHTHSFDAPIRKMREIVQSGELGRLGMIHTWNYTDLMYRPRMPHELDTRRGGGAVFIQGPHQVDVVRLLGGGLVRSVRGSAAIWDESRPSEGAYTAFLEFEDGTPATIVYNGYAHFDTAELHYWVGEGGQPRDPNTNFQTRARLRAVADEASLKESMRYAGERAGDFAHLHDDAERHQPFFGITLVSCQRGDLRQSPDGLYLYGDDGKREIPLERMGSAREAEINELYQAVVNDRPVFHDGRWGEATLEVCLAIYESARERRDVLMQHQVPSPA
ncbi:MAG TPA: Gfo/Idh/MocA family oxidoreductase [Chloroflexota bacterium]|nr:Gfo/Idh/MocA family oxidoreductase [Chloroflexota bacterium]